MYLVNFDIKPSFVSILHIPKKTLLNGLNLSGHDVQRNLGQQRSRGVQEIHAGPLGSIR